MSIPIQIASTTQFNDLLKKSKVVVVDFYADWCGPCKAIAPVYEKLSATISKKDVVTFTKVNTETQQELASRFNITSLPTFMVFMDGKETEKIQGANVPKLQKVITDLANIATGKAGSSGGGGGGGASWSSTPLPRGYTDVTDQADLKGIELLNADPEFGTARTLIDTSKPSALDVKGKTTDAKDWVESDTDEQLMLYIPFQATLKIHTLQITSLPPTSSEDDDDIPMRPKTIKLYTNKPHILGFDEADDVETNQTITLESKDWDNNGVTNIALRFVKFQNVSSLVMFVVDGDGDGEKTRIDRLRIIGETGEKRELGKLEKVGDEQGE